MYLFHTSGFALAVTLVYFATGYVPPVETTAEWWWQRPLWLVLPTGVHRAVDRPLHRVDDGPATETTPAAETGGCPQGRSVLVIRAVPRLR